MSILQVKWTWLWTKWHWVGSRNRKLLLAIVSGHANNEISLQILHSIVSSEHNSRPDDCPLQGPKRVVFVINSPLPY